MEITISIKKLAKDSFEIGRQNYIPILLNSFLYAVALILIFQTYLGRILIPAIWSGLLLFSLKCARGEKLDTPDSVLDGFKKNRWWKMALFTICWVAIPYIALLGSGVIFYIILYSIKGGIWGGNYYGENIASYITFFSFGSLGIYFAVYYTHFFYFLVEEPHDSYRAFRKSYAMVKRVGWWKTFACLFVLCFFMSTFNMLLDMELTKVFNNLDWRFMPDWNKVILLISNLLIAPFVISFLPLLHLRSKATH